MQFILRFPSRARPGLRATIPSLMATILLWCGLAAPAAAQGLFSPAITVNEDAITYFELDQRAMLATLLRLPGIPEETAREGLIEDRLKRQLIRAAGVTIEDDEIQAEVENFAQRVNLSAEDMTKQMRGEGIEPETLRDFLAMNLVWRQYVQERFLARARPNEAEIDRAMGQSASGGVRVLLSEIFIPLTPQNADQAQNLADQIARIDDFKTFSEAATSFSASNSRTTGGRLDWMALNKLPEPLRAPVLALSIGEVTQPILLSNAIALFQLRGIQEITGGAARYSAIDYAALYLPGGRSPEALAQAGDIMNSVDRCDDLYAITKERPEDMLDRQALPPGDIPRDVALELAKLDPGEFSTNLTRSDGQTLMLLMLCGRTAELSEDSNREQIANALIEQRLGALAKSLLEQQRADALIIER